MTPHAFDVTLAAPVRETIDASVIAIEEGKPLQDAADRARLKPQAADSHMRGALATHLAQVSLVAGTLTELTEVEQASLSP